MTSLEANLITEIRLEGTPKPAKLMKSRAGKIYNARKDYAEACKWIIKQQYRGVPYLGAVEIFYFFGFAIPKSWPKAKREKAARGGMEHTSRPDYDNLKKFYNDCIKKIVIKDDSQICRGGWIKEYTLFPRVEIQIYKAEQRK